MSSEGQADTPQGDPPPLTSWSFSGRVVTFIRTREQAEATIRFFGCVRHIIVTSPKRATLTGSAQPSVTPGDARRWEVGDFEGDEQADVIMRALKVIALDPAGRADTLLALEAHIAYLCGRFELLEPVL